MKSLTKELKELQIKEIDKLIFLVEQELFKKFSDATNERLSILLKIREEIKNEQKYSR